MNMAEVVTVMGITTVLAVYTVPAALRVTADARVTGALLQLHQYSKQSRYDAIVSYGQVRSVAIYGGEKPAIAECWDGVCGKPVPLPSGIVVKSTFRGIDAKVAGRAGSEIATLISWASETNSGIGGSFGQHGTVTFSHPWTRKKLCLVRGGSFGNSGEYVVRKDLDCR